VCRFLGQAAAATLGAAALCGARAPYRLLLLLLLGARVEPTAIGSNISDRVRLAQHVAIAVLCTRNILPEVIPLVFSDAAFASTRRSRRFSVARELATDTPAETSAAQRQLLRFPVKARSAVPGLL
jgi:hypothetical protein